MLKNCSINARCNEMGGVYAPPMRLVMPVAIVAATTMVPAGTATMIMVTITGTPHAPAKAEHEGKKRHNGKG
jgi:hypothetical protein